MPARNPCRIDSQIRSRDGGGEEGRADGHAGPSGLRWRREDRGHKAELAVTEADWQVCTDPHVMLEFLRGQVSDRKLRLYGCSCCRHIWDQLTDERSRKAVEVAEHYADGDLHVEGLIAASIAAWAVSAYTLGS